MNRPDFWCRVIGWLQVAGGAVVTATVYGIGQLFRGEEPITVLFSFVLPSLLVFFVALPPLVAGLMCLSFAREVSAAQQGQPVADRTVFRVIMGLVGLWSAGVVGFSGLAAPHLGFFALLGVLTTGIAFLGAAKTATLFETGDKPA